MNNWSNPWFDAWKDLAFKPPWQSSMEDWWRQFSQQSESPYLQAFENIVDQSRLFFQLAEKLNNQDVSHNASNWQNGLDQIFNSLKQSFDIQDGSQAAQLFWQMPLANWQRTVSSLSSFPGDVFSAAATHSTLDPHAKLDQFLSTPGMGYAREHQAEYQKLSRLLLDYQKAYQKYSMFFIGVNKQALDCMRDRLLTRAEGDQEPITSVRELYNLWVDCSETVYAKEVLTDDYAKMHGEMINALIALKQQGGEMMDDLAGMLNMPTRQEMDTIHQRFQSSRRSQKSTQQEMVVLKQREQELANQIDALMDNIKHLEQRIATPHAKRKASAPKPKHKKEKKSTKAAN